MNRKIVFHLGSYFSDSIAHEVCGVYITIRNCKTLKRPQQPKLFLYFILVASRVYHSKKVRSQKLMVPTQPTFSVF